MPAKSKSQQRLMGMVYAYKKGFLKLKDLPKNVVSKVKDISKSMSTKEVKKYASTDRKGLPKYVKEHYTFVEYLSEENRLFNAFADLSEEELSILEDKIFTTEAVSRSTASKVYHRDYLRTKDKSYRKYDPTKRRRLKKKHVNENVDMDTPPVSNVDRKRIDTHLRQDLHLLKVLQRETHPSEVEVYRGPKVDSVRLFYPVRNVKSVFADYREMFGDPVDRTVKNDGGVLVSHFHDELTDTNVDLYWNRNQGYLMGTFYLHARDAGIRESVILDNYYLDCILEKIEIINGK